MVKCYITAFYIYFNNFLHTKVYSKYTSKKIKIITYYKPNRYKQRFFNRGFLLLLKYTPASQVIFEHGCAMRTPGIFRDRNI